ncbi:MAG: cytochrome c biogenesis CcdA family protein [Gaiellaceae bacterium]
MTDALLAGSAAAAFGAGMVAFFAPCCSAVMVPTYLAAIGGGRRWRVARLTALYVAGVAVVVLPITLGASSIATLVSSWHPVLFVAGGLMMIAVAISLYRGTMISLPLPQPELTGSAGSVFALGAFSGAATACCAPVLAGAMTLSAVSGHWWGGLPLGGAYLLGLIAPLLPIALLAREARRRVRDPRLTLRLGGYRKQTTLLRLLGAAVFCGFGVLFIVLALSGNSESAPGFQRTLAHWLARVTVRLSDLPNLFAWPTLAVLALALVYLVVRKEKAPHEQQEKA